MRVWIAFAVAAAIPAAGASAEADLPIAGVWTAIPKPGAMGPDDLTLSKRSIKFGLDSEPVVNWRSEHGLTHMSTRSGLTYIFKQDGPDRICLMASLRTAAEPTALTPAPLRCFVKQKAGSSK